MLPPLPCTDNSGEFYSPKRVDEGTLTKEISTVKQNAIRISRPSPRPPIHISSPRACRKKEREDVQGESLELTALSMIPREFFIVETNAVLLPPKYPTAQYKSILNEEGQWETVVFPAVLPQNRQQVLYLRQTLDKMRASMPHFHDESGMIEYESDKTVVVERTRLMVEYTSQETKIFSTCFHELARQIKCICKEQSELLNEIREGYDAAVFRLLDQLSIRNHQSNQQQDRLDEVKAQCDCLHYEKEQLLQRIQELEDSEKRSALSALAAREDDLLPSAYRRNRNEECNQENGSELNDDEEEWRRQRASASISTRVVDSKAKEFTRKKHAAANLVQDAFKKYKAREEQARATLFLEKQAAARSIQRLYRSFRDRRLLWHRRAIMRTIRRRQKESAAVRRMQATVRAYLHSHRRHDELCILSERSKTSEFTPALHAIQSLEAMTELETFATTDNDNDTSKAIEVNEVAGKESRQMLMPLLSKFRKLASVIIGFNHGRFQSYATAQSTGMDGVCQARITMEAIENKEDLRAFQQTIKEAKALLGSLDLALEPDFEVNDKREVAMHDVNTLLEDDGTTLTDLLQNLANKDIEMAQDSCLALISGKSAVESKPLDIVFGTRDAMRLQKYEKVVLTNTLWHSAVNYAAPTNEFIETKSLLKLTLTSLDQSRRLFSLKHFISDMYDTIVGKLKELPSFRQAELLASHCHLALSFSEWRQQRFQLISNALVSDQPLNLNMEQLIREHYRHQLGLPQLVDAALVNLTESLDMFAAMDSDVKRFQDFMLKERSEEELKFCCLCRYLCAHRLPLDECPAGSATSTQHRQPMFHPVTMREIIDFPHVLELAKILFRVKDEKHILESDKVVTEVENAVYRQYLPTSGWHQLKAIDFVDPYTLATAVSTFEADDAEQVPSQRLAPYCQRPKGSPDCVRPIVRPVNPNQCQSNNVHAPQSPMSRPLQSRFLPRQSSLSTDVKWVYFDDVLALLLSFRREMNQFHLLLYWIHELFHLAASTSTTSMKLLDESAFVDTILPLSIGLSERELKNIFHNSLRQRELQVMMPLRVFTSVALLLLRNGLVSISTYVPLQNQSGESRDQAFMIQKDIEDKKWRVLALQWQALDSSFDTAIKAIYDDSLTSSLSSPVYTIHALASTDKTRAVYALQLLQLRQEFYDLLLRRSGRGRDFERACQIYATLKKERCVRLEGTRVLDF